MGKILALTNQKGGVGKTTTVIELSSLAARKAQTGKILVVDLDSQRNATAVLLGTKDFPKEESSFSLFQKEKVSSRHIHPTSLAELFVIPACVDLVDLESLLAQAIDGFFRLEEALSALRQEFGIIFLDCPPSLSAITINALVASDYAIIPIQISKFSLDGLTAMTEAIKTIQKRYNPNLKIAGAFLTMYDARTNLSQAMVPEMEKYIPLFKTTIPRSVVVEEAHLLKQDIFQYAPKSKVALAYSDLLREILDVIEK